jgi:hypothetical protein
VVGFAKEKKRGQLCEAVPRRLEEERNASTLCR